MAATFSDANQKVNGSQSVNTSKYEEFLSLSTIESIITTTTSALINNFTESNNISSPFEKNMFVVDKKSLDIIPLQVNF